MSERGISLKYGLLFAAIVAGTFLTASYLLKMWSRSGFQVDQAVGVVVEYHGPRTVTGVNTVGPTDHPEACPRAMAQIIGSAQDAVPAGDAIIGTCLNVKFGGPLSKKGAVIVQPFAGTPLEYILVGVEYDVKGAFIGAEGLHAAPDAATCQKQARDMIDSNQAQGNIRPGASLLIYCLPVPVLPTSESSVPPGGQSV
jgi:hypothetical protein